MDFSIWIPILMQHFTHYRFCPMAENLTMHHHPISLLNLFTKNKLSPETDTARHLFKLSQSFFMLISFCSGTELSLNSLCIQSPSVQFWDWSTSPSQSFPPFFGAGLLHSLLLHWVHSVPQADHLLHSVHTPSTREKIWRGGDGRGSSERER